MELLNRFRIFLHFLFDLNKIPDELGRFAEPVFQLFEQFRCIFLEQSWRNWLLELDANLGFLGFLHDQLVGDETDVVDRVDDLAYFTLVGVLLVDVRFEVLL